MSPERVKKFKQVLDAIALRLSSEGEDIGAMMRFMGQSPVSIPYDHFPSSIEPSEVNELLGKLANHYHLIEKLHLEKDQVSFGFPARLTKKGFEDFRKSVTAAYKADQNKKLKTEAKEREKEKLYFSKDGNTEYRGHAHQFTEGTKARAMIETLFGNPFYGHTIKDMQNDCNKHIFKEEHKFKGKKDVKDTLTYIRKMLKVKKGEHFPIQRRTKDGQSVWILLQK